MSHLVRFQISGVVIGSEFRACTEEVRVTFATLPHDRDLEERLEHAQRTVEELRRSLSAADNELNFIRLAWRPWWRKVLGLRAKAR